MDLKKERERKRKREAEVAIRLQCMFCELELPSGWSCIPFEEIPAEYFAGEVACPHYRERQDPGEKRQNQHSKGHLKLVKEDKTEDED